MTLLNPDRLQKKYRSYYINKRLVEDDPFFKTFSLYVDQNGDLIDLNPQSALNSGEGLKFKIDSRFYKKLSHQISSITKFDKKIFVEFEKSINLVSESIWSQISPETIFVINYRPDESDKYFYESLKLFSDKFFINFNDLPRFCFKNFSSDSLNLIHRFHFLKIEFLDIVFNPHFDLEHFSKIPFLKNAILQLSVDLKQIPCFVQKVLMAHQVHLIQFDYNFTNSQNSMSVLNDELIISLNKLLIAKTPQKLIQSFLKFLDSDLQFSNSKKLAKWRFAAERFLVDKYQEISQKCTLPFTQISIYPDGSLKPCCWLLDYKINEKNEGLFDQDWNSNKLLALRKQFISNQLSFCKDKVEKISCHTRNTLPEDFVDYSEIQNRKPQKLHWYFNGKCNLECQTCHNWKFDKEFPESDLYWNELKKSVFPYLCELEVVGGEPFYQPRTYQLIKTVSQMNPYCNWYLTTNGQFNFKGAIKDHLDLIYISFFSVSIDSFNENVFSKIRKNGDLNKALKFLNELIDYKNSLPKFKQFKIMVNFVLQKENWNELPHLFSFCKEKGVSPHVIPMVDPPEYSVYSMLPNDRHSLLRLVERMPDSKSDPYLRAFLKDYSAKFSTETLDDEVHF